MEADDDFAVPVVAKSEVTVFVKNLPLEYTDDQLKALVEPYGSVKRSFIARERGQSQQSRGFGYVIVKSQESAEKAVAALHENAIDDYVLHVALAKPKESAPKQASRATQSSTMDGLSAAEKVAAKSKIHDQNTVVLTGLSMETELKQVFKKVKKIASVDRVLFPSAESKSGSLAARIIFTNPSGADKAIEKLDKHIFKGSTVHADYTLRSNAKLVVRNLPFDTTESDLRSLFEAFGKVFRVTLPRDEEKVKGFAFIHFTNMKTANAALEGTALKTTLRERSLAVDWAVDKETFAGLQAVRDELDLLKKDTVQPMPEKEAPKEVKIPEDGISKDVKEKRTLFARNIPFTASHEDVVQAFREKGQVPNKVLLVQTTTVTGEKRPRGTGFIEFTSHEEAAEVMDLHQDKIGMDLPSKLNTSAGFAMAKAVASEGVGGIFVQGRLLDLSWATSRDEAEKMATAALESKDKRLLYLAKEGLILEGTEAAEGLDPAYMDHRMKLWRESKTKLENPNISVSKLRLAIHNLPLETDEAALKKLVMGAVDAKAKLKQIKIVRDKGRTDSKGNFRSKRYGFIEFLEHEHALQCLRELNNNPTVFGKQQRPILAFALNDARKLQTHALHKRKSHASKKESPKKK